MPLLLPLLQGTDQFETYVNPLMFSGSVATRMAAKAARLRIIDLHNTAKLDTAAALACNATITACRGKRTCELQGCVPRALQYACVNDGDFAILDGGGVADGLVLQFGSSNVSGEEGKDWPFRK